MLRAIWEFRGFVTTLALSGFRVQSTKAVWGYSWLVIEPAIQIGIYVLIFSAVLRAKLPESSDPLSYSLYVCSGLLSWNFFAELVLGGRTVFLENADLLRTIRFPRSTLPAALVLRCGIRAAIPVVIFAIVLVWVGRWPGIAVFGLMPFIALQVLFGVSLAVLAGTLNVFIRDVGIFFGVAIQFWFWLTPIVYPLSIVPGWAAEILSWNPMLHIVAAYQAVIVGGNAPDWSTVLPLLLCSVTLAGVAWLTFRGLSPDLVDEL
jgi:lipopolysaccharide transport system permease protein